MTTLKRLYLDLPTETIDKIKGKAATQGSTLKEYVTKLLNNDLASTQPKQRSKKHGAQHKAKAKKAKR